MPSHEPFRPARCLDNEIETKIDDYSKNPKFDQCPSIVQADKSFDSTMQRSWIDVDENWW